MNVALMLPELTGGGAQRASQVLGDYLISLGCNVFYFLLDSDANLDYVVKGKIVYIDISEYEKGINSNEIASSVLNLRLAGRIVKEYKQNYNIDISISFMEKCNYLNVFSKTGDKIIISIRTTLSERDEFKGALYNKPLISKIYKRADCIVAVSNYVKNDLVVNYNLPRESVTVIPNAAMQHGELSHEDSSWNYGNKTILSVARINPEKQHDHLIKAFKEVKRDCSDAELVILGKGPLEEYMKWFAEVHGVRDCVHFVGYNCDIGFYMRNSRVFVMTSKAEGFPNSMVEAMAYGIPVVTTNSPGGCREIVGASISNDEYTDSIGYFEYGILTPYIRGKARLERDYDEDCQMAKAITAVLTNDEIYEKYRKKSFYRSKYYSYENVMKMWDKLIER